MLRAGRPGREANLSAGIFPAVGKRADLLVLDGGNPYLRTARGNTILNRWLFAGGDRQVRDVMVAGQWRVRDGKHALEEQSTREFAGVLRELLA